MGVVPSFVALTVTMHQCTDNPGRFTRLCPMVATRFARLCRWRRPAAPGCAALAIATAALAIPDYARWR
jgi:hypothetical protein